MLKVNKLKQLTQAVFKPYKQEVIGAAVDSYGTAWGFTSKHIAGETGWNQLEETADMTVVLIGHGFDATDWQNSAIDREIGA